MVAVEVEEMAMIQNRLNNQAKKILVQYLYSKLETVNLKMESSNANI